MLTSFLLKKKSHKQLSHMRAFKLQVFKQHKDTYFANHWELMKVTHALPGCGTATWKERGNNLTGKHHFFEQPTVAALDASAARHAPLRLFAVSNTTEV